MRGNNVFGIYNCNWYLIMFGHK